MDLEEKNRREKEREKELEEKDKRERERDQELAVAAKLQLEEWSVKYNEKIASIKAENRKREELRPKEDDAGESLEWDKVVDLCGFKSPKSVKDTSRMRSILLKLKESKT